MSWFDRFRRGSRPEVKSFTTYQLLPPSLSFTARWSQYSRSQAVDAYRKSVWLYDCVNLRASNLSSVPWIVEVKRGAEWEVAENHELMDLLNYPNPDFDFPSLIKRAIFWLDLTGDAWFTKVRNGAGRVVQWWPLLPDKMAPVPGRDRLVDAWKYQQGGMTRTIPADDIVHLMYSGPESVYYGLSPLAAAAQAVDVDMEAANFQKVTLQNHGIPPSVFEGPMDLTQEQYEQGVRWIDEQSGPERSRKPWILGGFKFHAMSQTPHELDFLASRKVTRSEICSAFGVPPAMVGIYDGVGGLNAEIVRSSRRIFWMEGLIPVLRELEGQFNRQLAAEWGPDVRMTYELAAVEALEDDQGAKIERAGRLWAMGVPLEEINRVLELGLNMDAIPGGDRGYLSSGLLPTDFDMGDPEPMSAAAADTYGEGDDG